MVKTLTGSELLSLYQRRKLIHRLVRWNLEYVKYRNNNWLRSSTPPKEPLELIKVYKLHHTNGNVNYVIRMFCSDMKCGCRNGFAKHPWVLDEDGIPIPNIAGSIIPAFAKHGAFIINP